MDRLVVVTDHGFDRLEHLSRIAGAHDARLAIHQTEDVEEVAAATAGAVVVLNRYAPITREVLSGLAARAVVIRYGIGYDNVDMAAARELGVRVANVPDYGVDTVADHTVALILSLARRIVAYDRAVRTEGWLNPVQMGPVRALSESKVGLVGTGRVGRLVAARMAVFGCEVLAYDPYAGRAALAALGITVVDDFQELAGAVDILSLHAPLTPSTHHIVDSATLRLMKPSALLVNTARGGLVDTEALAAALVAREIAGAALDVVDPEPPLPTSCLWETGAVITPHAAFYSETSVDLLERLAAEEAGRALAGAPLRCLVTDGCE